MQIENIIFDFGGVLVDWNPRYFYRDHFATEEEMEHFLANICTDDWNKEQDKGRPLATATALLQKRFPEFHNDIQLYYDRWDRMLKTDIPETVALLHRLKEKYKIYGLTNWSAETIPVLYKRFSFFKEFNGIVVSGEERLIKPDKRIFYLLLERFRLNPKRSLFIDDNHQNVEAAQEVGLQAIHFKNPATLEALLIEKEVL